MREKTKFLHIRLLPKDHERLKLVASENYLELSVWARQALLRAADEWQHDHDEKAG